MGLVHQDRWMLGGLRDGRLLVLADTSPEPERRHRSVRPLSKLARRCLHDGHPLSVTAIREPDRSPADLSLGPRDGGDEPDWEVAWPALLYAPVGLPGRQPVGLLLIGSRTEHWYSQEEIDYMAALGVSLTAAVLAQDGRLSQLGPDEKAAARLLGRGLSVLEMARALEVDEQHVRRLMGSVLKKLSLRSPKQPDGDWPEIRPFSG